MRASIEDMQAHVTPQSTPKMEPAPVKASEEEPLAPGIALSVVILSVVGLVDAIEYGMVMPSLSKYIAEIQGSSSTSMYGLVLSLFSAVSMISKPFVGSWCDRRSFREVYLVTIILAIAGAIVYALASRYNSIAMVFIGRMLGGVGAANTSLLYAYVSRTVPTGKQTFVMMLAGMTFPVGMVLGPVTNLITTSADFTLFGVHWTDTNSPGLLLAVFLVILFFGVAIAVSEPAPYNEAKSERAKGFMLDLLGQLAKPAVLMCFLVIFAFNAFIAASEAVVVPVTQHATQLEFTPLENSYVYAGVATWILILSVLIMVVGKRASDRGLVLLACVSYSGAVILAMRLWDYDMPLWKFLVGEAALITAVPFAFSPNRAVFSKMVKNSKNQALLSSLLSIVASCGSIAGPLWMGATAGDPQASGPVATTMFWGLFGLSLATTVLVLVTWFGFCPPKEPDDEPLLSEALEDEENPLQGQLQE